MNLTADLRTQLDYLFVNGYLPYLPNPKQRKALEYTCTELLFGGAAGGSKSSYLLMAAALGITVPNYSALIIRRTYQDLSLPGAIMDRSHEWWTKTDAKWKAEDKTWTFPSGARISFGYMEGSQDHLRYQGSELQFVGIDEISQFPEHQALYLLSRLRGPIGWPEWLGLRYRGACNPGGIGHQWLQKRYRIPTEGTHNILEQRVDGKLARVFVPAFASDNPGLDVTSYHAMLANLDPLTRAQLKDGKWLIDAEGLVYYCYNDRCNVDQLPPYIKSSDWRYVLAADWAGKGKDKTAFAVLAFTEHEPEVYLRHTEQHHHMTSDMAAKRIRELEEEYGGFVTMVGDGNGLGSLFHLELAKEKGIFFQNADKANKLGFIKLFNGSLNAGTLKIVAPYCEAFINQAKVLLWSDTQKLQENQSQHNDVCDAALYGWRYCRHYATHERQVDPSAVAIDDMAKRDPEGAEWMQELLDEHRQKEWQAGAGWGSVQPWG
jgi:hypothetical protein